MNDAFAEAREEIEAAMESVGSTYFNEDAEHARACVETTMAANVSRVCTILVYVLAGTPEFVDVTYELAVGNVNIHVLTTLAVFGTVLLGCAMEGALLLLLFVLAHFVEDRLTLHARGDLKALWGTVPTTADVVQLLADGTPALTTPRATPAADVAVRTTTFVQDGEHVPSDGRGVHASAAARIHPRWSRTPRAGTWPPSYTRNRGYTEG